MRIAKDHDEDEVVELINLTPLLDVVFNLIIFFMVTTQFVQDERDLKIKLPNAESAQTASAAPQTIIINVRQDGRFLIAEKSLDRDELKKTLQQAKRQHADTRVVLRVDRETPFRHPVVVFDICKGLGLDTSLATIDGEGK